MLSGVCACCCGNVVYETALLELLSKSLSSFGSQTFVVKLSDATRLSGMRPILAVIGTLALAGNLVLAPKNVWLSTALSALVVSLMFGDTFRGGVDMASASMRFLYNKASRFGLSSFSEEELSEEEKRRNIIRFRGTHVGGLYNEGNTCFINSVVQSLASCETINSFVNEGDAASGNFSTELAKLVHDLNRIRTTSHSYSTGRLMQNVGGSNRWARLDQEDAQEFFQQLLVALESDWKARQPKPVKAANGEKKEDEPQRQITPFDGHFAMRVGCLTCGDMEGIRTGILSSVDISLDIDESESTLESLLENYCHMETISDVECYRCSLINFKTKLEEKIAAAPNSPISSILETRVSEVSEALKEKVIDEKRYATLKPNTHKILSDKTKQTMFAAPMADILMVHINRSVFDMRTGFSRKNYAPVEFPAQLDMSQFVADPKNVDNQNPSSPMHGTPQSPEWYDLKATVIHYGSANFGHYVCFRKFNGFWWRISDDTVDLTTETQVLNAQGVFMLFYEKRTATPSRQNSVAIEDEGLQPVETSGETTKIPSDTEEEQAAVSVDEPRL